MEPLTESTIRKSFVNASRSEVAAMNLPAGFADLEWEHLDQLGWRDHKMPQRAYLVLPVDGKAVGVLLRAPELSAPKNRRVMCALCQDVYSEEPVFLYVARRAGQRGRDGNTVGTLIHADFTCSANVRAAVLPNPIHPDPELVIAERISGLRERSGQFMRNVMAR
ncbi:MULTISPECIES: FBP domain-containing protein [unclassified Arthrobacter]|uniref:FBP domain-containing protein n=1 Tax=unclassified Arthrobacter TaxID=235627 RepID=UPI001E3C2F5D|nr:MULTISPECIES: FBP domain-containing protein [unclassified Arthrobacter]MCC9144386.1 FBP domain-containing protein [Arthrobacter sp. zg-Y919]MDK1275612.1 FBP domain-containing protein [Arthrobacter sp. zg.Y919]MDM7991245.1 FBP domain-containing protein [Arthrobacter sp. zg-Y877]WIB03019.1 FBP domain-containing protein [Arthrobacter sp. zg-Y919]